MGWGGVSRNISGRFRTQEAEISAGLMGHLACMQTLNVALDAKDI